MKYITKLDTVRQLLTTEMNEDTRVKELGMDSLDVVELSLEIEEKYGVVIDDAEIESLTNRSVTLRTLDEFISELVNRSPLTNK